MRAGDYVRTKRGIIGKIKLIDNQTELEDLYLVKRKWYYKEEIIKSSPNIIDLIEVGDYVNGEKVGTTIDTEELAIRNTGLIYDKPYNLIKDIDIKSIVTKEVFESIEYKINKENK